MARLRRFLTVTAVLAAFAGAASSHALAAAPRRRRASRSPHKWPR